MPPSFLIHASGVRLIPVAIIALFSFIALPDQAEGAKLKWSVTITRSRPDVQIGLTAFTPDGSGGAAMIAHESISGVGETGARLIWLTAGGKIRGEMPVNKPAFIVSASSSKVVVWDGDSVLSTLTLRAGTVVKADTTMTGYGHWSFGPVLSAYLHDRVGCFAIEEPQARENFVVHRYSY